VSFFEIEKTVAIETSALQKPVRKHKRTRSKANMLPNDFPTGNTPDCSEEGKPKEMEVVRIVDQDNMLYHNGFFDNEDERALSDSETLNILDEEELQAKEKRERRNSLPGVVRNKNQLPEAPAPFLEQDASELAKDDPSKMLSPVGPILIPSPPVNKIDPEPISKTHELPKPVSMSARVSERIQEPSSPTVSQIQELSERLSSKPPSGPRHSIMQVITSPRNWLHDNFRQVERTQITEARSTPIVCEISYNTKNNEDNNSEENEESEPKHESIWAGKIKMPEENPEIEEKPKKSNWKPWKSKNKDRKTKKHRKAQTMFQLSSARPVNGPRDVSPPPNGWRRYKPPKRKQKKEIKKSAPRKSGPRDFSPPRDYTTPKYELPDIQHWTNWKPTNYGSRTDATEVPRKNGPRDVSPPKDWIGPTYELPTIKHWTKWQPTDMAFQTEITPELKEEMRKKRPCEYGKPINGWKPEHYSIELSEGFSTRFNHYYNSASNSARKNSIGQTGNDHEEDWPPYMPEKQMIRGPDGKLRTVYVFE